MPLGSVTWPSCRFFTSWASQRLVVVSSFRTWAKVVSLSWSGRHCRRASLALRKNRKASLGVRTSASSDVKKASNQPGVVREAQVTADYVLEQTGRRLFGELQHHFALKDRKTSRTTKERLGVIHAVETSRSPKPTPVNSRES